MARTYSGLVKNTGNGVYFNNTVNGGDGSVIIPPGGHVLIKRTSDGAVGWLPGFPHLYGRFMGKNSVTTGAGSPGWYDPNVVSWVLGLVRTDRQNAPDFLYVPAGTDQEADPPAELMALWEAGTLWPEVGLDGTE